MSHLDGAGLPLVASPVALTLSDGTRWHGDPIRPRWDLALGLGLDRFAGTFQLGQGSFGIAVEGRLPVNADLDVGVTAAALASPWSSSPDRCPP